jgi:hypothetical protein
MPEQSARANARTTRTVSQAIQPSDERVLDNGRKIVDEQRLPLSMGSALKCQTVRASPKCRQTRERLLSVQSEEHVPTRAPHPHARARERGERVTDPIDESPLRSPGCR